MSDTVKEGIIYLVVTLVLIMIAVVISISTNNAIQENCEERGGQFYRSLDANRSFCAEPRKDY